MSAGDALLDRLPRATLVAGKGGVGKTTCAAALARRASERFGGALVLSTDPARALPLVLDAPVGAEATPVPWAPALAARTLDAEALRSTFLARWGPVLRLIIDRGTYLDDADIGPLVDTALPGGDEIFAALALAELLAADAGDGRVLIDTAPTGHTLRLLALPRTFRALVRLLDAMQAKHRFMVRTLTRAYRADDADAFIADMGRLVGALEDALRDARRCAALVVTRPEPLVVEETRRLVAALRALGIDVAALLWNATTTADPGAVDVAEQYVVPRLEGAPSPTGAEGLRRWYAAIERVRPPGGVRARRAPQATGGTRSPRQARRRPDADLSRLVRPLTIVAGKGGVGKTTVACALALCADDRPTLLVSTDPAPSLADALAQPVPDADTPVPGAPHLAARQMDATAAFERLRAAYAARVDALFDAVMAHGVDLAHDRTIARDLLALAPPGVDEVYALTLLGDALLQGGDRRVVVDPAPTGHLLRLLEMPRLALAWTHQLMRVMLKYKDVTGLGDTARDLLEFSRQLRALDALVRDPERCGVVLVTLEEPVVRAETERLAGAVRANGVAIAGVVRNRRPGGGSDRGPALPVPDAPVHFEAPEVHPPPVGVSSLRRWAASWLDEAQAAR